MPETAVAAAERTLPHNLEAERSVLGSILVHNDAFNLADKLARILHGKAQESELDRYERQRRHIAVKHTQAQTIRNKRLLEERDPQVHRRRMEDLVATANDPARARAHMLESSMIAGLRKSAEIK